MSSGSSGRQPWSIVARCDPTEGEIITAHNGDVQILLTFFGADVLRQRSEIAAAVKKAAGSDLDNKFLERVLEAANASVRAARPLNSNQGASIAIAYQDANHELTSLALGKCQVWLGRGGGVWESTNAYPDIYLGESGFNAGRWLAPEKQSGESGQKLRVVLAPQGYNPSLRRVRPSWLTLLVIAVFAGVGWLGMSGVWSPSSPLSPTPTAAQSETSASTTLTPEAAPVAVAELPPTETLTPPSTATRGPSPTPTPTPTPTSTPLPTATATFTPVASQSPEPGVIASAGVTPTITLVLRCSGEVFSNTLSGESIPIKCTVSGELPDPYLLEVVIWHTDAEDPDSDLVCFLDGGCGKSIGEPRKDLASPLDLLGLSGQPGLAGYLQPSKRYKWALFVVEPEDPNADEKKYKRTQLVKPVGFNGIYPEFEFSRPPDKKPDCKLDRPEEC